MQPVSPINKRIMGTNMATKSFATYVSDSSQEYKYTIKLAIYEMTDCIMDCLEQSLQRYQLKSASVFRKTPIQESPLDFPNVKNTPVFMSDVILCYPASLDFLRNLVANSTGISLANISVYSENDPRQIETDLYLSRTAPDFRDGYQTQLGSDYPDQEKPQYGDTHNLGFLKSLEDVRKGRKINTVTNSLIPDQKTDHTDLPTGYDEFNDAKSTKTDTVGFFGRNRIKVTK